MNELAATFLSFSVKRMQRSEQDILTCVSRLSEEQIWHRPADHENSIANLLLHLEGNMRQWILHGVDDQPDVRARDAEFALAPSQTASEVRARFSATLAECCAIISNLDPERLLAITDPQPGGGWGSPTILEAIYLVVGHVQMHTGQIILLTKQMTGRDLDLTIPRKR
jgi:uncharacterized damage-inducible protein DinB